MPKEYIEREKAYELARTDSLYSDFCRSMADLTSLKELLEDTPAADVVEVVRCGECIHHSKAITPGRVICDKHAIPRSDTDFCSDGRRDKPEK